MSKVFKAHLPIKLVNCFRAPDGSYSAVGQGVNHRRVVIPKIVSWKRSANGKMRLVSDAGYKYICDQFHAPEGFYLKVPEL